MNAPLHFPPSTLDPPPSTLPSAPTLLAPPCQDPVPDVRPRGVLWRARPVPALHRRLLPRPVPLQRLEFVDVVRRLHRHHLHPYQVRVVLVPMCADLMPLAACIGCRVTPLVASHNQRGAHGVQWVEHCVVWAAFGEGISTMHADEQEAALWLCVVRFGATLPLYHRTPSTASPAGCNAVVQSVACDPATKPTTCTTCPVSAWSTWRPVPHAPNGGVLIVPPTLLLFAL
jgi:hypothetical protein